MKLKTAITFAIIFLVIPFIFYFLNFNGELSTNNSDWGSFGSYIGGSISSIFSFLSFFMVLIIYYNSQKEKSFTEVENRVFKYIELLNSSFSKIRVDISGEVAIGDTVFSIFNANAFRAFSGVDVTINSKEQIKTLLLQNTFYKNSIMEYLELVKIALSYIDSKETEKKDDYMSILSSQLSEQQKIAFAILMFKELEVLTSFKSYAYKKVPVDGYIDIGRKMANFEI